MFEAEDVAHLWQSWPYLALVSGRTHDEAGSIAIGFVVAETLVASTSEVAGLSEVAVTIYGEGGEETSMPEHSGFVARRDKHVTIVEISPRTLVDLPRLAPTGARLTTGQQCVIPVLRENAMGAEVYAGQVTGVSADESLSVELGNLLFESLLVAGSPVIADGVIVGVVAATSGPSATVQPSSTTVRAYAIEEVQRLLQAPMPGPAPRPLPNAETESHPVRKSESVSTPPAEAKLEDEPEQKPRAESDTKPAGVPEPATKLEGEPDPAAAPVTERDREPEETGPSPPLPELGRNAREALRYIHGLVRETSVTGVPSLAHAQAPVVLGALWHASRPSVHSTSQALFDIVAEGAKDDGEPVAERLHRAAVAATQTQSVIDVLENPQLVPREALTSPPLDGVLAEAQGLATDTGHGRVGLRHLVAAALSAPPADALIRALNELGLTADQLRVALRSSIAAMRSDDSAEAWDRILATRARVIELEGGFSADVVDPTRGIPLDRDHLGVRDYVTMLATLIADKDTPMPLSVGLFGEWGSGKSYFMGLLRGQVEALAGSGSGVYHTSIRQIGFNAWHYADANLWASLGDEIFAELAAPAADPTVAEQSRRLQEELDAKLQSRLLLQEATQRAQEETARLSAELDQACADVKQSRRELLRAAKESETVRTQLDKAWPLLGADGADDGSERERLLAERLDATPEPYDALRLVLRDRRGLILGGAAFGVLLVVLALVVVLPSDVGRWIVGGGLVTLGGIVAAAVRLIDRFRDGLRTLNQAAVEINESLEQQKTDELADEIEALRAAQARERVVQAQLDEVVTRVGELGRELARLSPGQRLYTFVTERAGSDEYRRHLGLISTVRKDFQQLTRLMDDWRERVERDEQDAPLPIDRIVLYIDDLDRCSPRQVVDVLQAVHLLLALELFVVVVGVDPRWLLRSLRTRYRELLTSDDQQGAVDWQASPQDYLEKIFHIPFALPRMTPGSFEALLDSLAAGKEADDDAADAAGATPSGADGGAAPGDTRVAPPASGDAKPAALPDAVADAGLDTPAVPEGDEGVLRAEKDSTVDRVLQGEPELEVRPLTPPELQMLTALAPLVQTPREAKRLVNLYRMIRSIRNLGPAEHFLGDEERPGDYQAVVILLGLLSGHGRLLERVLAATPDESNNVLGGLRHRPAETTWAEFVNGIKPKRVGEDWKNDIVGDIPRAAVEEWEKLSDGLRGASTLVTLTDLSAFQEWAPRVARFSFLLSQYAADSDGIREPPPA